MKISEVKNNMDDEKFFIARARILGNVEKGGIFFIFFEFLKKEIFYEFGKFFLYSDHFLIIQKCVTDRDTKTIKSTKGIQSFV
jgi:hypothetical protein